MTKLETAMCMLIAVFDEYSAAEGSKKTLSKAELKTLMEKELPGFLSNSKDKDAVNKFFKELDVNGDSEVDFNEFIILMAALTCICHEFAQKASK
ncbi:protein S100-P [Rhinatrema bivittatum]|uniref:protein S100-P n=1 Tax=Rhinatrema bivittatum TaxID=194408 RepID=UPI001126B95E|nr:protein S100-P [Rhinatrema bivittatum]